MRRAFIIAGIITLLGGGAYLAYVLFFQAPAEITVTPTQTVTFPTVDTASTTSGTPFVSTSSVPTGKRFVKISAGPIVPGLVALNVKPADASSTPDIDIRFIERRSGNVYSYMARSHVLTRLSNRTIPGVQSASWSPTGALALVRYLSGPSLGTVNTYVLPANGANGFFLAQNLADSSMSSTTILALASGVNGSVATTQRSDGTGTAQTFSSPLSQMLVSFLGKSSYLAVTKASAAADGYAYTVTNGNFLRLTGPFPGLTALASPSGKWVLATYADESGLHTALIDASSGELIMLPIGTLSEKCVWTANDANLYCGVPVSPPAASYPDDWYQGVVSFTDRIWKISVEGRYAQLVFDPSVEAEGAFDVRSLTVDQNASVVAFVNKRDGSLWSYEF